MRPRRTVEQWRRVVIRSPRISDAVRVYLLVLADHMRADRTVSVPRARIAEQMGRHPQRIAERTRAAHDAGFLDTVSPGYKGHTAVYQGLFPEAEEAPKRTDLQYPKELLERYPIEPDCVPDGEYTTSKRPSTRHAVGDLPDERRVYGEPGQFPDVDEPAVDQVSNEGSSKKNRRTA